MAHEWFIKRTDSEQGPLSAEELKQLALSGQIAPTDLVRRADMVDWKQASSVKGLFSEQSPPPIPPLPASAATNSVEQPTSTDSPNIESSAPSFGEKIKASLSELLGTAKAAKELTTAQTRRAKLSNLDLPAAYLAFGKNVFESGSLKSEFADLFERIEKTKVEIQNLGQPSSDQSQANEFKDKVRAGAASLKAKGQQKVLSVKLDSLYRELGKNAFEAHREGSGPQELSNQITRCRDEIESLDENISRLSDVGKGKLLTPKRLIIGAGVLLLMVIGAVLPDRPSSTTNSPGQSSSSNDPDTAAYNATALLVVNLITENRQWGQTTPNRFQQLMEQAASEMKLASDPKLRHLIPIRPTSQNYQQVRGRQALFVRYGSSVHCSFLMNASETNMTLFTIEIDGKEYTPIGSTSR